MILRRSTKVLIGGALVVTGGGMVIGAAFAGFLAGVGIMQYGMELDEKDQAEKDQAEKDQRTASIESLDAGITVEPPETP